MLVFLLHALPCMADEGATWTLAAEQFALQGGGGHSDAELAAAALLPQLLLELVADGAVRVPLEEELLQRRLYDLQSERIALFLELSAAVKKRDSLVLQDVSERKLRKLLAESGQTIADIQRRIAENLAECDSAVERSGSQEETPAARRIALYKNNSTALFVPGAALQEQPRSSRDYERAVLLAKIDGLLCGKVAVHGDYIGVTVDLLLFPSALTAGTVTEVGRLSELPQIARNISRALAPILAHALPVRLHFSIQPEEAAAAASLVIDGVLFSPAPQQVTLEAGAHTISVAAPGFVSESVSYSFSGRDDFLVSARLRQDRPGELTLFFRKPIFGEVFAGGEKQADLTGGSQSAYIRINGTTVLGHVSQDDGLGAYFYIPEEKAAAGAALSVSAEATDLAAYIDKRRRRLYTAYTALTLSLPLTFYCNGKFESYNRAYANGAASLEEVDSWRNRTIAAYALSGICGAVCVYQLVRYLLAADKTIPARAKQYQEKGGWHGKNELRGAAEESVSSEQAD